MAMALALVSMILVGKPLVGVASAAEQAVEGSAIDEQAGLGINDYKRLDTGTSRKGDGIEYGYRYTMDDVDDFVVFACDDEIVAFIPEAGAQAAGLDPQDADDVDAFMELVYSLDGHFSSGSNRMRSVATDPVILIGATSYTSSVRTYDICVGGAKTMEDGQSKYHYAIVSRSDGQPAQTGLVCLGIGHLVSAGDTAMEAVPSWYEELGSFLSSLDMRPLWVSLKTSGAALVAVFFLGIFFAWKSVGVKSRWKGLVDSIFTIPMVLPPTVCGFLLLLFFGNATDIGRWLIAHGIKLVFTWEAAVIAATVVSFPLMYRTARGAFEALDSNMLDAARTLGWSEWRIFVRLMIPLAWPSIAAGTVLAFARAMGEFGATLFFAGNYAGVTQTMPIAIYFQWMAGNTDVALFWVVVIIIISFLVILAINLYSSHSQRYRASGMLTRKERRMLAKEAKSS